MELPRSSSLVIFMVFFGLLGIFVLVQLFQLDVPVDLYDSDDSPAFSSSQNQSSQNATHKYYELNNRNLRMRIDRLERAVEEKDAAYATLQADYARLSDMQSSGSNARSTQRGSQAAGANGDENLSLQEEMVQVIASLQEEVRKLKVEKAELERQSNDMNAFVEALNGTERQKAGDGDADRSPTTQEMTAYMQEEQVFRSAVSQAMVGLGSDAVPALVSLLGHEQASTREWAAYILGTIGPEANAAVPSLVDALTDSDATVRTTAREAITAIENSQ